MINFDDFSDLLTGYESPLSCTRINCDQNTAFELERECGSTFGEVSHLGSESLKRALELHLILCGRKLETEAVGPDLRNIFSLSFNCVFT